MLFLSNLLSNRKKKKVKFIGVLQCCFANCIMQFTDILSESFLILPSDCLYLCVFK